jgi:hypothetical protein
MERTAFTSRLGEGQGRLSTGVFILGDNEPGRFFELAVSDHVEVTQSVDVTDSALVRCAFKLRVPDVIPSGLAWEVSILVDGKKYASLRARAGRERIVTDLAANVSKLTGVHVVGVRLELVAN